MKKKFTNPYVKKTRRSIVHFLLWQMGYYADHIPLLPIPKDFTFPNPQEKIDPAKPLVTWVNHSTFWVKACGKSLLMDPIWTQRCSPFPFLGPKRQVKPQPPFEKIEDVDCVIISHNHYDHLDKRTIRHVHFKYPSILWIVPKGVKKWFLHSLPIKKEKIIELTWWESFSFDHLTFTAVPAQHFSGRGLFDLNKSLWMGCVIEFKPLKKRLYFVGDTGYNEFDFKEIGNKFGGMDLSLIPIGVYAPRKFMKPVHINPDESILIHKEVRSKLSVAGHWGTFRLSSEGLERPPFDLFCALQKEKIDVKEFRVLKPGQSINW